MLVVKIVNGWAISAEPMGTSGWKMPESGVRYENRNDWKTLERANKVAVQLSCTTGLIYVATDSGPNVSPRYDVVAAPAVGDKVSRGFNGDYYQEGEIVKVSASLRRVVTSTGVVFYRRGLSGSWVAGRTWSMVTGHVSRLNPSF